MFGRGCWDVHVETTYTFRCGEIEESSYEVQTLIANYGTSNLVLDTF